MRSWLKLAALATAVVLGACGGEGARPGGSAAGSDAAGRFDAGRAFALLRAQVRIGPRPAGSPGSRREVELIASRLRASGFRATVQRPYRNVVATIPGSRPGAIVVGAHHDTKDSIPGFVGANDGASGVAVLLELARVLPRPMPGPSVVLAFFDAEEARGERSFSEDGTRGSRQFVRLAAGTARQGAPSLEQIKAMYLLDMVGDCDLAIPRELYSSRELYARLRGPPFGGETGPVSDDHVPFLFAGIPAVDLIDFDYGPGQTPGGWWHTPQDTLDKVCSGSLGEVGRAMIAALLARA